jgi:hypothetical protein
VVSAVRREWSLCLALVVAAALRMNQLGAQILVGDEWHALEKAASASWTEIATSFGRADHSIPIALYYKLLASTIGLTETWIRLPFLLAGLATVAALALAARRIVPRAVADTFAWFLAVSPVLAFYSRFARPYALTCPLALAALLFFRAWWRTRRGRFAAGYAASVALGAYFHAAILPFALAPFLFYGVRAVRAGDERRRELRGLLAIGALTGVALAILLLPPFLLDSGNMGKKSGFGLPQLGTVARAARIFVGPSSSLVALASVPFLVLGIAHLARRVPGLTALFALAGAAQCAAVALIAPAHRSDVFAFARYVLPLLPPLLLALACGVHVFFGRASAAMRALAGPLLGGLLAALGPFPSTWFRPDNWSANHLVFHMLGQDDEFVAHVRAVPAFYLELRERPPASLTLIEAPWFQPIFANPLPHYQRMHRQHTEIGFTSTRVGPPRQGELPYPCPGFELENFVFLEDLLGSRTPTADYLVLHRDLRNEYDMGSAPVLLPLADEQHEDITPYVERARARFGAPVFEDALVVVFRLR